jgi:hypothetical protein
MRTSKKICIECFENFEGGNNASYCIKCRNTRTKKKNNAPPRKLGQICNCVKCNKEYISQSAIQKYCENCKQRIPVAQQTHKCAICNKEILTNRRKKTCSDKCKRELINKNWVIAKAKRTKK